MNCNLLFIVNLTIIVYYNGNCTEFLIYMFLSVTSINLPLNSFGKTQFTQKHDRLNSAYSLIMYNHKSLRLYLALYRTARKVS